MMTTLDKIHEHRGPRVLRWGLWPLLATLWLAACDDSGSKNANNVNNINNINNINNVTDPCATVDCGGHGQCVERESAAACDCDAGYHEDGLTCVADAENHAPSLDNLPATAERNVGADGSFTVLASDPDGDGLDFSTPASACPFSAPVMDPATGEVTFTCGETPVECEVAIRVTDAGSPALSADGILTIRCLMPPPTVWCVDLDGDGFGDPDVCIDVQYGTDPPADTVPQTQATDCDDADAFTFPGAAELDDPAACMQDRDEDGYGASSPLGPDAIHGTDCNDFSSFTFPGAAELDDPAACMSDADQDGHGAMTPTVGVTPGVDCNDVDPLVLICALWCADLDADGFGAVGTCVGVPEGQDPPAGTVQNADDCYDADAFSFPGSAELDDPAACARDFDGDGWAEAAPPAGVTPGRDCDDTDGTHVVCVTPTATCLSTNLGGSVSLGATATGGDGTYSWLWDHETTLSDAEIADPVATPVVNTNYTVVVSDGLGNLDDASVTVHIADRAWTLGGTTAECAAVGFLGAAAPHSFANFDTTTCTTGNSDPTAYVCSTVYQNTLIQGTMVVNPPADDDDFIGFVWGYQDSDHYYLLTWKQAAQNIGGCNSAAGMTVKRVARTQPYAAGDFTCNVSTPNSTVLMTPAQTTTQGWIHGVTYSIELSYAPDQTEITIMNTGNSTLVANFIVTDATYPSGQFGTFDYSQIRACNGPWTSSCL